MTNSDRLRRDRREAVFLFVAVHESAFGTKRTSAAAIMFAFPSSTTRRTSPSRLQIQLPKTLTEEERAVNTRHKMALTMLAVAGVSAAVIQGLHAQAKPPIYVVIAIQKITDAEAYKPLPVKGQAAAEAAGGHYLIRTGNITSLDGIPPARLALIKFDSIEKAQAWYNSTAQKEVDVIRAKSTGSLAFLSKGLPSRVSGHGIKRTFSAPTARMVEC